MASTLILNAALVNEGETKTADLLIQDGRIAQIGNDLAGKTADRTIDATGKHLSLPYDIKV